MKCRRGGNQERYVQSDQTALDVANISIWCALQTHVICATCAFGMGIDSSARYILHLSMPSNLDSYLQEIGRCGRDGEKAFAVAYYSVNNLSMYRNLLLSDMRLERKKLDPEDDVSTEELLDSPRMRTLMWNLMKVQEFAEPRQCRRRTLMEYYDERLVVEDEDQSYCCDYCLSTALVVDIEETYSRIRAKKKTVDVFIRN